MRPWITAVSEMIRCSPRHDLLRTHHASRRSPDRQVSGVIMLVSRHHARDYSRDLRLGFAAPARLERDGHRDRRRLQSRHPSSASIGDRELLP
jgi:hypothetical protein